MKVLVALSLLFLGSALAIQAHWSQEARASPQDKVTIRFALAQHNLDVLETTLLDTSDPTSANYGKWWTPEAITDLIAPSKEDSQYVVDFLKANGITETVNHRDSIKAVAPVYLVEELLRTSLYNFVHKRKESVKIIRAVGSYEIPIEIAEHVDFVAGLYEFPRLRNQARDAAGNTDGVDGYIVPYVINNLYQIPTSFPVHQNSSICLAEFQDDQSYDKADLKKFSTENALTPAITVSHVVGPFSSSDPDAESTLDVEFGAAISQNTTVWFWTVEDWMYDFAVDVFATKVAPYVISMSWGWPEPNQCDVGNCTGSETSKQYVSRTNVEFQKLGLRGITLLAASGDQGAPGDDDPDCDERGDKALSTIFPGASPWVLSVGATMLTNSTTSDSPAAAPPICQTYTCATSTTEEVCTYPEALITTGGGFSNYAPTPAWQQTVVSKYLSSSVTLPPAKDFNKTNRGFPDVSALGHNYLISLSGDFEQVDGTSCSTPVFAAIIALLNSYRFNNNKPSLGFVNQVIYQAYAADPTIFTDITTGDNKCTESCCATVGYEATAGWDPVTGLGTPNFPKLLKYVASLP